MFFANPAVWASGWCLYKSVSLWVILFHSWMMICLSYRNILWFSTTQSYVYTQKKELIFLIDFHHICNDFETTKKIELKRKMFQSRFFFERKTITNLKMKRWNTDEQMKIRRTRMIKNEWWIWDMNVWVRLANRVMNEGTDWWTNDDWTESERWVNKWTSSQFRSKGALRMR